MIGENRQIIEENRRTAEEHRKTIEGLRQTIEEQRKIIKEQEGAPPRIQVAEKQGGLANSEGIWETIMSVGLAERWLQRTREVWDLGSCCLRFQLFTFSPDGDYPAIGRRLPRCRSREWKCRSRWLWNPLDGKQLEMDHIIQALIYSWSYFSARRKEVIGYG